MYSLYPQLMSPHFHLCPSCSVYAAREISISSLELNSLLDRGKNMLQITKSYQRWRLQNDASCCSIMVYQGHIWWRNWNQIFCDVECLCNEQLQKALILEDYQQNWMTSADDFNIFWFDSYFGGFCWIDLSVKRDRRSFEFDGNAVWLCLAFRWHVCQCRNPASL